MPVDYRYDEVANRLTTRCEGSVNPVEVAAHFRKLGRDARLKPYCDVLLDLSFLTRLPSPEQVEDVATMIEDMIELVPFGRCAVVAGEDIGFKLGGMFQGFTWPLFTGIRLFRMNADAIGWLDAPAD